MTKRAIFQGYATRSLDDCERLFKERFNREPSVFVIPIGYTVTGSRENHEKVFESRFAGYMAVYIPHELTLEEVINLETDRTTILNEHTPHHDTEQVRATHKRYCYYCGQVFDGDISDFRIHCGKYECIVRYTSSMAQREEVKARYAKPKGDKPNRVPVAGEPDIDEYFNTPEPQSPPKPRDDFTLDAPFLKSIEGWVYLIESDNGLYKLGRSDDVWDRFRNLSTENAAHLTLRHAIHAADYFIAEAWLHRQFAAKRHHGEWFTLANEDIDWFCGLSDGALDALPAKI